MVQIKLGDLVEVLGESDNGTDCFWWGEVVGYDSKTRTYELYYVEEDPDRPGVWAYNEHYDTIVKENVNRHVRTRRGDYERAWREAGFVMHRSTDEAFHHSDQNFTFTPIETHVYDDSAGSDCDTEETLSSTDTWSTEEDEEEETAKNEMIDFIVPDNDADELETRRLKLI
tara:strand:- start:1324 stop:1836 length:513 start_codon:yes stop_codon:yes gene_type:complete